MVDGAGEGRIPDLAPPRLGKLVALQQTERELGCKQVVAAQFGLVAHRPRHSRRFRRPRRTQLFMVARGTPLRVAS
jgi:hypothetical protein